QPEGLPAEGKPRVAVAGPSGFRGQVRHFTEGKGALPRESAVVTRHRVAVDELREEPDARRGEWRTHEIRREHPSLREPGAVSQECDGIRIAEMVERQRAVDHVELPG